MTHDRYDNEVLKQLTRIANSLEKTEKRNDDILKELTRIANSLEEISKNNDESTIVKVNKTLDEQNLPNCWRCKNYDKYFALCMLKNTPIEFAENACCTEYRDGWKD